MRWKQVCFKREEEGKARVDGLQKADDESLIKSLLEGGCDESAKEESDCIFYIPELGYGSTHLLVARVSDLAGIRLGLDSIVVMAG